MGTIAAVRVGGRKSRLNVFVDGSFSFTIDGEVAARAGLQVGHQLSADRMKELVQGSLFQDCIDAALRYLSYRPRSEAEVRRRLYRHGCGEYVVDKTITELKGRRLIDDVVFAQFWKDNRLSFSPRSGRMIKLELMQKGIAGETADEAIGDVDDETSAYEAGQKKARALAALDYGEFYHRLSNYLRRRGFSYEVIDSVVTRLWRERQAPSA